MAAELRWILLGLSSLLLAGIWWWGRGRSRQAPGNAELRESTLGPAVGPAHAAASADEPSVRPEAAPSVSSQSEHPVIDTASRDWGVPPFEPLNIRTADFESVQIMDPPMTAAPDPLDATLNLNSQSASTPQSDATSHLPPENSGRFTAVTPQAPNVTETQRIVTVRVCAQGESRWAGYELKAALENHGLQFGRYRVFHRNHSDGRTLFCAASLVEPGTFDIARMPEEEFRGLTLFAVLPGPAEPLQTIDALIATAGELAETLRGTVQDSQGLPLSAERAEALREDVARFQASPPMTSSPGHGR